MESKYRDMQLCQKRRINSAFATRRTGQGILNVLLCMIDRYLEPNGTGAKRIRNRNEETCKVQAEERRKVGVVTIDTDRG